MNILVMGGTRFIGRHFVTAALAREHRVTLFHRGRGTSGLFPGVEHVLGDRDEDLSALRDRSWDATVDFSAYAPHQVRALGQSLGGRAGRYVFFSTTAAYAPPQAYGFREDAPLVEWREDAVADDDAAYGGLKALCEREVAAYFPDFLVLRPTYVVGPHDYTGRFTYWVDRVAAGGEVLAPGPADAWFQFIDVRDLTQWAVGMIERRASGPYQVAHPFPPVTFGEFLERVAAVVAPPGTRFTWVDQDFALASGLDGVRMPLWPGANPPGVVEAADPARAVAAGLRPRPLEDTVRDLFDHESREPTPVESPVGISRGTEAELLAAWEATGQE